MDLRWYFIIIYRFAGKLNLAANQVDDGGNANNELHHSETVAPSQDIKLAKTYETFQNTGKHVKRLIFCCVAAG